MLIQTALASFPTIQFLMASKWKWMYVTELELVFTFVDFARAYSIANK